MASVHDNIIKVIWLLTTRQWPSSSESSISRALETKGSGSSLYVTCATIALLYHSSASSLRQVSGSPVRSQRRSAVAKVHLEASILSSVTVVCSRVVPAQEPHDHIPNPKGGVVSVTRDTHCAKDLAPRTSAFALIFPNLCFLRSQST